MEEEDAELRKRDESLSMILSDDTVEIVKKDTVEMGLYLEVI